MCEVFNRLKEIGVVRGTVCPLESTCELDKVPGDNRNYLIHCSVTSLASMQESQLTEESAQELVDKYKSTQK